MKQKKYRLDDFIEKFLFCTNHDRNFLIPDGLAAIFERGKGNVLYMVDVRQLPTEMDEGTCKMCKDVDLDREEKRRNHRGRMHAMGYVE